MEAALIGPTGRVPLGPDRIFAGRTADNQIVIDDPKASAHHIEVRQGSRGYMVRDLGSLNGTFVNEQRLETLVPRLLAHGDRIRIGDTVFTYEVQQGMPGAYGSQQFSLPGSPTAFSTPGFAASFPQSGATFADNGFSNSGPTQPHTGYSQPGVSGLPPQQAFQPSSGTAFDNTSGFVDYNASAPASQAYNAYNASSYPPAAPAVSPYAATPPQLPALGVAPPPGQPPQKKDRRLLWISLALLGVLLLGGIGVGAFFYLQPTPSKTLDKFCSSLQGGDYQTAYGLLTPNLQHQTPRVVFSGLLASVSACSYSQPAQTDKRATATLALTTAGTKSSQAVTLLQDSSNAWKIDADATLTAPTQMLAAYCSALKSGNAQNAYTQLSTAYQGRLSQKLFASLTTNVTACSYTFTSAAPTKAAASVVITYRSANAPENNSAALILSSGAWKIDALSQLSTPARSLMSFCTLLQSKDYQTSYELLTQSFQGRFGSEGRFASIVDSVIKAHNGIKSCAVSNVQQTNSTTATGNNQITYSSGSPEVDHDTLLLENTIWKLNAIE